MIGIKEAATLSFAKQLKVLHGKKLLTVLYSLSNLSNQNNHLKLIKGCATVINLKFSVAGIQFHLYNE